MCLGSKGERTSIGVTTNSVWVTWALRTHCNLQAAVDMILVSDGLASGVHDHDHNTATKKARNATDEKLWVSVRQ